MSNGRTTSTENAAFSLEPVSIQALDKRLQPGQ
jgi:hypothetical protein